MRDWRKSFAACPIPLGLYWPPRQLDLILHSAPEEFGESRFETVRVGFVHPLGIQNEVLADVQTVIVYDVWRIDLK